MISRRTLRVRFGQTLPGLILILSACRGSTTPPCFGLTSHPRGYEWTYSGTRLEADRVGVQESLARVTWTTTLVDARSTASIELALVRGFITDLAWSDPSTKPRLSLLVCSGGRLSHYEAATDDSVSAAFAIWDASFLEES